MKITKFKQKSLCNKTLQIYKTEQKLCRKKHKIKKKSAKIKSTAKKVMFAKPTKIYENIYKLNNT